MEEVPTPPLDTPEKRQLFEIIRKMMAKTPGQRFQNADELIGVLEGSRSVTFTTDATQAMPSMTGARMASAPTTPLPRATGTRTPVPGGAPGSVAVAPPRRSVLGGLLLWLLIVGAVFGGGGFYAYKQGLIFAKAPDHPADSTLADSTTHRDSAGGAVATDTTRVDTSRTALVAAPPPTPSGPPGRLVLQGLPRGARIAIEGQQISGTQVDLPSGVHRLTVRAAGYQTYDRQVTITPGQTFTMRVTMESNGEDATGPCDQYGPAYNQDNLCFDVRPVPLSSTLIPVSPDAPIFPRQAILLIHVSREGTTIEARIFGPSNVDTFNNEALDMVKNLRWNPAQKNGEPTEAWVQWPFQPVRQ
jgi:TonB family protein